MKKMLFLSLFCIGLVHAQQYSSGAVQIKNIDVYEDNNRNMLTVILPNETSLSGYDVNWKSNHFEYTVLKSLSTSFLTSFTQNNMDMLKSLQAQLLFAFANRLKVILLLENGYVNTSAGNQGPYFIRSVTVTDQSY